MNTISKSLFLSITLYTSLSFAQVSGSPATSLGDHIGAGSAFSFAQVECESVYNSDLKLKMNLRSSTMTLNYTGQNRPVSIQQEYKIKIQDIFTGLSNGKVALNLVADLVSDSSDRTAKGKIQLISSDADESRSPRIGSWKAAVEIRFQNESSDLRDTNAFRCKTL